MVPLSTQRASRPARRARARRAQAQRGVTAIEFALIFPLFFTVLYAIVTFSLIFVAQQNLTLAASEGARAALNWQANTSLSSALAARSTAACTAAKLMTANLVQSTQCTSSSSDCGTGMKCVNVQLTFNYSANPLVPTLPLLGFAVPSSLSSSATVQLNPENIQ
jgi:Flp pilus assembly protein TadG